jgi:hypothetical protein
VVLQFTCVYLLHLPAYVSCMIFNLYAEDIEFSALYENDTLSLAPICVSNVTLCDKHGYRVHVVNLSEERLA